MPSTKSPKREICKKCSDFFFLMVQSNFWGFEGDGTKKGKGTTTLNEKSKRGLTAECTKKKKAKVLLTSINSGGTLKPR